SCLDFVAALSSTACSRAGSSMGVSVPHLAAATASAICTRWAARSAKASNGPPPGVGSATGAHADKVSMVLTVRPVMPRAIAVISPPPSIRSSDVLFPPIRSRAGRLGGQHKVIARFEEGAGQATFGDLGGVIVTSQPQDETVSNCVGD